MKLKNYKMKQNGFIDAKLSAIDWIFNKTFPSVKCAKKT